MRVIVIGLGSMGRRRVRLLKQHPDNIIIAGVDTREDRRNQAEEELGIDTYKCLEEACGAADFDAAFISTSPLSHSGLVKECLEYGMNVFTELNLTSEGYKDNQELAKAKEKLFFVSSTFLYRKEIGYIKDSVMDAGKLMSYNYHVGQYLPDWHPWEDYTDFFVGKKETNGCRELMAIEFPWLSEVFGEIEDVLSVSAKHTELNIDYPDTYCMIVKHKNGHMGVVTIDVVSRKPVRNFEVCGERLYLKWNGTPAGLFIFDYDRKEEINVKLYDRVNKRDDYCDSIIEDGYYCETADFIELIKNGGSPRYTVEKDEMILKIIDKIEGK